MKEELERIIEEFIKECRLEIESPNKASFREILEEFIENKEKEAFEAGITSFDEFDRNYNYDEEARIEGKNELFKQYKRL